MLIVYVYFCRLYCVSNCICKTGILFSASYLYMQCMYFCYMQGGFILKLTSCARGDTICLRLLQVDNIFVFIRQVAPVRGGDIII